jgi:hypothetical protein
LALNLPTMSLSSRTRKRKISDLDGLSDRHKRRVRFSFEINQSGDELLVPCDNCVENNLLCVMDPSKGVHCAECVRKGVSCVNFSCGNSATHCVCFSSRYILRYCSRVWFNRSVYPSVSGWYAVDSFLCIPMLFSNCSQKFRARILSLSEVIDSGIPWRAITSLANTLAKYTASYFFSKGINRAYFVSLSTITYMFSYCTLFSSLDVVKGPRKSIVISVHSSFSALYSCSNLYSLYRLYFTFRHRLHLWICS